MTGTACDYTCATVKLKKAKRSAGVGGRLCVTVAIMPHWRQGHRVCAMLGEGKREGLLEYPRIMSTDLDDLRLFVEWH